jgi:hypothetical protein
MSTPHPYAAVTVLFQQTAFRASARCCAGRYPEEHEISFRLPDALSPKSAGVNDDSRLLDIAVASLALLSSDGSPGRCD